MKSGRIQSIVLFFVFLVIYVISKSEIFAISHDSVVYINGMKNEGWLFHSHHLLWHDLNRFLVEIFSSLTSGNIEDYSIMSYLNSLFGALGVIVVYNLFKSADFNVKNALVSSSIIGLNFGFWHYSATVEVYMIPIFFMLLNLYEVYTKKRIWRIILYSVLATLFHQSYIFLMVINALFLYRKYNLNLTFKYVFYYSLLVGIPYIVIGVFVFGNENLDSFFKWLAGYSYHYPEHWSEPNIITILIKDFIGFSRSVVSTQFILTSDWVNEILKSKFQGKSLDEEAYMLRNLNNFSFYLVLSSSIFIAIYISNILYKVIRNVFQKEILKKYIWLYSYIIIFALFFSFWSSDNPEFWISINVVLFILYFLLKKNENIIIKYVVLALFIIQNSLGFFLYVGDRDNDLYYNYVKGLLGKIPKESNIITNGDYKIKEYLDYYEYNNVFSTEDTTVNLNNETYYLRLRSYPDSIFRARDIDLTEIEKNIYRVENKR